MKDRAPRWSDLGTRAVSGVLLAILALIAIGFGGWPSALLAAVAGGVGSWELLRITRGPDRPRAEPAPRLFGLACGAAVLATHGFGPLAGVALLGAAGMAGAAIDRRLGRPVFWAPVAAATAGLAGVAFVSLRDLPDLPNLPDFGLLSAVWIGLIVVATDTGAYAAGRLIGGPKLWPRVSPNKTWAGLAGGAGVAAIVGVLFSTAAGGSLAQLALVSALGGVVAQGGDLAESALKRRFGVKDSSHLIPGHGGVLDRLDGFCAVTLVAAALTFLRSQPVFMW